MHLSEIAKDAINSGVDLGKLTFHAIELDGRLHSNRNLCRSAKGKRRNFSWKDIAEKDLNVCPKCAMQVSHPGGWSSLGGTAEFLLNAEALRRISTALLSGPLSPEQSQIAREAFERISFSNAPPRVLRKYIKELFKPTLEVFNSGVGPEVLNSLSGRVKGSKPKVVAFYGPAFDDIAKRTSEGLKLIPSYYNFDRISASTVLSGIMFNTGRGRSSVLSQGPSGFEDILRNSGIHTYPLPGPLDSQELSILETLLRDHGRAPSERKFEMLYEIATKI